MTRRDKFDIRWNAKCNLRKGLKNMIFFGVNWTSPVVILSLNLIESQNARASERLPEQVGREGRGVRLLGAYGKGANEADRSGCLHL